MKESLKLEENERLKMRDTRLWILQRFLVLSMTLLVLRLAYMQIGHQFHYLALANRNRVDTYATPSPRGTIFDHTMRAMAYDRPAFSLIYARSNRPIKPIANTLSHVLGTSSKQLQASMLADVTAGVHCLIASRISDRAISFVREHQRDLPGVEIIPDSTRTYPFGDVACHLLGYINSIPKDRQDDALLADFPPSTKIGWSGVERSYDDVLRGHPGKICMEVDSQGVPIRRLDESREPVSGQDLVLTVDASYQAYVQRLLVQQLHYLKAHGHAFMDHAMAVALNPNTGAILAMASVPTYNPQWFIDGISYAVYEKQFAPAERNWATQAPVAPGSVMKPLTAFFAMKEAVISPNSTFRCDGQWDIPLTQGPPIRCWTRHENVSLRFALAKSCDVYFYKASLAYGNWPPKHGVSVSTWLKKTRLSTLRRLETMQHHFGLGNGGTGVDLPEEASGYVNEGSGQVADLPYTAIGQNEVFTTLELATYTATLAHDGIRPTPHVVEKVGRIPYQVRQVNALQISGLQKEQLHVIQEGMYLACNDPCGTAYGTFHHGRPLSYTIAGKTGTAETGIAGFDNAVFIGYAPYRHPQIAIAIVIPGGGHGADSTGPIARAMFDRFFSVKAGKALAHVE